jgi:hypothetical protein
MIVQWEDTRTALTRWIRKPLRSRSYTRRGELSTSLPTFKQLFGLR